MNIYNIQGMNAYTANAPMAEKAPVQNNNKQATDTELNQENTQTLQQAFQVEITQQAMTLQAQKKEDLAEKDQVQLTDQQTTQVQLNAQTQQAGPLQNQQGARIDIIA
ncbi:hypothetical protein [uncultured Desulfobacter sp.]|uniref:hypothetical protein n=1 Tax=uncultured Desulfobacter sp. TaxID=240139 RepID=UPI002AA6F23C|nr:hypothetical protein [uncultured Desulfobacter sp.]